MRFTLQTVLSSCQKFYSPQHLLTIPVLEVTAPSNLPAALLVGVLPNPFYSKIRWVSGKTYC